MQWRGLMEMSRSKKECLRDKECKLMVQSGFTLVELSLSLVFIAILSIAVVLVMTGAISSYHRSITLNKVENVGSNLVRDIKVSIQNASANGLTLLCDDIYSSNDAVRKSCEQDKGKNFSYVTRYAFVKVNKEREGRGTQMPVFGAMCTGSYTYIWNSGYLFDQNYSVTDKSGANVSKASLTYKYNNGAPTTISDFKLLKVKDSSRKVCESAMRYDKNNDSFVDRYSIVRPDVTESKAIDIDDNFNMAKFASTDELPVKYLEEDDGVAGTSEDESDEDEDTNNMAIYNMSISIAEQNGMSRSSYYYGSFILGTIRGGIDIVASGNFCSAPEGYNESVENIDYCAINKFNFAALATGG